MHLYSFRKWLSALLVAGVALTMGLGAETAYAQNAKGEKSRPARTKVHHGKAHRATAAKGKHGRKATHAKAAKKGKTTKKAKSSTAKPHVARHTAQGARR